MKIDAYVCDVCNERHKTYDLMPVRYGYTPTGIRLQQREYHVCRSCSYTFIRAMEVAGVPYSASYRPVYEWAGQINLYTP